MNSIYGFWHDIVSNKQLLKKNLSPVDLPYKNTSFSYVKTGRGFPNFSIKLNKEKSSFSGGELVKVKNRNRYLISPFKSDIPRGRVDIKSFVRDRKNEKVKYRMEETGDDVFSLEKRDVYSWYAEEE